MSSFITADDLRRRARLQEAIDRKDAERGRPLTDAEKLENLRKFMEQNDGK